MSRESTKNTQTNDNAKLGMGVTPAERGQEGNGTDKGGQRRTHGVPFSGWEVNTVVHYVTF